MALYDLVATIPVGDAGQWVAVNPAGTKAYLASNYSGAGRLQVINLATNTVSKTLSAPNCNGVALTPDGTKAFTSSLGTTFGSWPNVFETAGDTNIATASFYELASHSVVINPAGTKAYFTHFKTGSTKVTVMNAADYTLNTSITVGSIPSGIAINPAGTRVYVTNFSGSSVSVINTATDTVTATVAVGGNPRGIAVNPAGTRVYAVNYGGQSVSVIDTSTNTVTATIPVGTSPFGVVVNPSGTKAFVSDATYGTIRVIDTATNTVIFTTPQFGTRGAGYLAVNPAGTRLYVTRATAVVSGDSFTNGSLYVIDIAEPKSSFFSMF